MRRKCHRKDGRFEIVSVVGAHWPEYTEIMAKIHPQIPARRTRQSHASKSDAKAENARKVKPLRKRAAADRKAALGELPQWTTAQIAEAFRRFKAANPEPKAELQHLNAFTLLVAVVLSAQATDAGVNKATPALFASADTPEKMAALGEEKVRELIKTIGLFRTKAKTSSRCRTSWSRSTAARCRARARRWRLCRASAARPPMSCSISPSASRPSRSIRIFSASATAPDWHRARRRSRSRRSSTQVVPAEYKLHAHHWLILHGRYTCVARKPLCEKCIISDLCQWPGKTVCNSNEYQGARVWKARAADEAVDRADARR